MLGVREHVPLFCLVLQFKKGYEQLVSEVEDVEIDKDAKENEKARSQRPAAFKMESKAIYYVQALEIHRSGQRLKGLKLIFVAECATHF